MGFAIVPLRARIGVFHADVDRVLVEMIAVDVMKVAVVQEIAMTIVLDGPVTAAWFVLVVVPLVNPMRTHAVLLGPSP